MERLLAQEKIACVLDATHPYAVEASRNAKTAAQKAGVPYIRVLRQASDIKGAVQVTGCDEAAAYLATREGKALITTGSKELAAFTAVQMCIRDRYFTGSRYGGGANIRQQEAVGAGNCRGLCTSCLLYTSRCV